MKLLRYLTIAAAVGVAFTANTAARAPRTLLRRFLARHSWWVRLPLECRARPAAGCATCGHGKFGLGGKFGNKVPPQPAALFDFGQLFHRKPQLPVFQAAPWYNYWPYDGHFLTPAPVSGPFYGPPMTGNFPVNPYFPGPAGAMGFGPIPGGPPPGLMAPGGR